MAYTVKFYSFDKRRNSTKLPTTDDGFTSYTCDIRNATGILAPTIVINAGIPAEPYKWNYAKIEELDRYYFVIDWAFDGNLWMAMLDIDVLGSYRAEIENYSAYVTRSSSAMNGRVVDAMYPIIARLTQLHSVKVDSPFNVSIEAGCFVVGILNAATNSVGATSYYVFTNSGFRKFSSYLFANTDYLGDVSDISDQLLKSLFNPFQYVASCIWLPIKPAGTPVEQTISLGWWTVQAECFALASGAAITGYFDIAVPKHPDALARGYWLLTAPYSRYFLDIPPFGSVDIDSQFLIDCDNIRCAYDIDVMTGNARMTIGDAAASTGVNVTRPFCVLESIVGANVQLASSAPNLVKNSTVSAGISSAIETVQATTDWLAEQPSVVGDVLRWWRKTFGEPDRSPEKREETAKVIGNAVGGSSNIALAKVGAETGVQTVGCNGGFASGQHYITLVGRFASIASEDNENRGRPLCEIRKLGDLEGFVMCGNPAVSLAAGTVTEAAAVNAFLRGGCYLE